MNGYLIRALDVVGATALLVLSAIPMVVIGVAIRLSDRGPALFRQVRVGIGAREFTVLKFRTMRVAQQADGSGSIAAGDGSPAQANAHFHRTVPGDPRITKLGRILRPSHMDELPQLLNILSGDMSFVGVRPDTPLQAGDYTPEYWQMRHRYKPGLTGPAQLLGGGLTLEERSSAEKRWITQYGLREYFAVLSRTFGKVLRRDSF